MHIDMPNVYGGTLKHNSTSLADIYEATIINWIGRHVGLHCLIGSASHRHRRAAVERERRAAGHPH